jgi:hypothetical protein
MPADRESSSATTNPPPAFPDVGWLLWRRELWGPWLEEHPDEAELLVGAYRRLVRLTSHTGWDEDRTLARLGCGATSDEGLRELATERLGLCSEYFGWVETLLVNLEVTPDKRLMVSGAARIFAAAEQDLRRCKATMSLGSFPPLEYLRLGEVAQAWQSAVRGLSNPRGDRARAVYEENPFVDESTPHLSPKRLDMLDLPDSRTLLGVHVRERMLAHVKVCAVCEESRIRRAEPELRPRQRRVRALA